MIFLSSKFKDFKNNLVETFLLNKSSYPVLEGLRGVAIIMVFNIHFLGNFYKDNYFFSDGSLGQIIFRTLYSGHLGVDLFFILSGFLIFRSLLKSNPKPFDFIKKRVTRLLPSHLFMLLILAYPTFQIGKFILNLLLVPGFTHVQNYNDVTWSLSWEMLFYGIIFVFFLIYKKISLKFFWRLLIITLIILLVVFTLLQSSSKIVVPVWGRFLSFFLGVIIAYLETLNFKWVIQRQKLFKILAIICIALIIFAMYF